MGLTCGSPSGARQQRTSRLVGKCRRGAVPCPPSRHGTRLGARAQGSTAGAGAHTRVPCLVACLCGQAGRGNACEDCSRFCNHCRAQRSCCAAMVDAPCFRPAPRACCRVFACPLCWTAWCRGACLVALYGGADPTQVAREGALTLAPVCRRCQHALRQHFGHTRVAAGSGRQCLWCSCSWIQSVPWLRARGEQPRYGVRCAVRGMGRGPDKVGGSPPLIFPPWESAWVAQAAGQACLDAWVGPCAIAGVRVCIVYVQPVWTAMPSQAAASCRVLADRAGATGMLLPRTDRASS